MQSSVRLLIRFRHFSSNPRNAWAALVTVLAGLGAQEQTQRWFRPRLYGEGSISE